MRYELCWLSIVPSHSVYNGLFHFWCDHNIENHFWNTHSISKNNVNKYLTQYAFTYTQTKSRIDDCEYNLSDELKKRLWHDLKDILIEWKFNGNLCNSTDFTWSFDPKYNNCYTFNSGYDSSNGTKTSLKQSTISGLYYGLQLTLYVNVFDKFFPYDWLKEIGAVIRIGNSSFKKYYSNGDGILLSTGLKTNKVVEREFKSILP